MENTCDNPSLDGLLYVDRESKRPSWHIYKTYAEMEGVRLHTMTDRPSLHALAALDPSTGTLRLLLGKYEDYSTDETRVIFKNVGRLKAMSPLDSMRLCAERIPDVGSGPLDAPVATIDQPLPTAEDEVTLTLPQFHHSDAYRLVVGAARSCHHGR